MRRERERRRKESDNVSGQKRRLAVHRIGCAKGSIREKGSIQEKGGSLT